MSGCGHSKIVWDGTGIFKEGLHRAHDRLGPMGFPPRWEAEHGTWSLIMASEEILSLYHTGLRNAHALEQEASQIIGRQLDRLENYPAVANRLRTHLEETRTQQNRLETILTRHQASHSTVKDMVAGFMGNMAALGHTPAADEILKNSFANIAFENYEIAAYRSLIQMAEAAGDAAAVPQLQLSLAEEEAMAAWLDTHLAEVTSTYMQRAQEGKKADR
jgi:ferritin-like metal-binding protein YciE